MGQEGKHRKAPESAPEMKPEGAGKRWKSSRKAPEMKPESAESMKVRKKEVYYARLCK
ncbi:MAG: hypothetical protein VB031_09035 [Eubacteriaceae bacterium]|nr:hypothetical protein [Eubacteriaceae bacterium]